MPKKSTPIYGLGLPSLASPLSKKTLKRIDKEWGDAFYITGWNAALEAVEKVMALTLKDSISREAIKNLKLKS